MRNDLTHAITSLGKSPGYAFAAVLTLALGIGANTAIFSVINDVLLRDLPYAEPQRLVMLWEEQLKRDRPMSMGVAAGVGAAFGLTRLLQSQLYELSATDPVTFVIASAFLMLIAVLACWPAARRAASVEPMAALRAE